jgi:putative addiction module CopG family antidote
MTIHLPEHLEQFVRDQVKLGRYPSEDAVVRDALEQLSKRAPSVKKPLTEEELERQLVQAGFLGSVPPPRDTAAAPWNFEPIRIEGEPLSETIIRERR